MKQVLVALVVAAFVSSTAFVARAEEPVAAKPGKKEHTTKRKAKKAKKAEAKTEAATETEQTATPEGENTDSGGM